MHDANILLYALDTECPNHEPAKAWREEALNGPRRVGIPWVSSIERYVMPECGAAGRAPGRDPVVESSP